MSQKVSDNGYVISISKFILMLGKLAYIALCVLDLSKVSMYEFYYDYVKNKYGNNSILVFTGTDSLIYEIKTKDFYEDFSKDKEILDFSNYLAKSNYYNDSNKLVLVKKKDETAGVAIEKFVGLKPKDVFAFSRWLYWG